jgi:Holliday junction resolvasome RuvABC endonuclease subunit
MSMSIVSTVAGFDLSLRASAAVVLPPDWSPGDWSTVRSMICGRALTKGATEHDRIERVRFIAEELIAFVVKAGASDVFIEAYSYSKGNQAHQLGELGGVVRLELRRAGLNVHVVPLASARRLLLGKVPRSDAKVAVFSALRAAGWNVGSTDEADALCVASFGLTELGRPGLSLATKAA